MTIDERLGALTMNVELLLHSVEALRETARDDGEDIRTLARIAGMHERRLTD